MGHGQKRKEGYKKYMGRYTGPKHKLARREGVNLLDKTSARLMRRLNTPPGIHGAKRKKRLSEYGQQLREKQKAKSTYGIMEKQLSNLVKMVQKQKGETGELLISLLESRLDNVVYRLGLAKTRFQSRQFVSHGHILVNGKKLNIASYHVKKDDTIALAPSLQKNPQTLKLAEEEKPLLPFLEKKGFVGRLVRAPKREDVEILFSTQMIIEYYSR